MRLPQEKQRGKCNAPDPWEVGYDNASQQRNVRKHIFSLSENNINSPRFIQVHPTVVQGNASGPDSQNVYITSDNIEILLYLNHDPQPGRFPS